ncbi:hypothetical protein NECAME_02374 [Necator americanus]|uniref:Uncharacterized protein n=1 Tax=Necator americanus TaxID=51031 RepID=W2THG1_NECAM|nr:hypothetical protein NECAME_02374 [Necator americanus]ETN80626.1 hypothetical protein NECAME_02374 [Necator americanus]
MEQKPRRWSFGGSETLSLPRAAVKETFLVDVPSRKPAGVAKRTQLVVVLGPRSPKSEQRVNK